MTTAPGAPSRTLGRSPRLPGSIVLKMALGEAPDSIPVSADVLRGRLAAAQTLDGGVCDRLIRHYAGAVQISRVHAAARSLAQPGQRHCGFDDREQVFGLARTFRVNVPVGTPIDALVDSLRQVTTVESASPNYVTTTPFAGSPATHDQQWQPWEAVHAAEALAHEPGDRRVIVGIIDSGVAPDHPDLPPMRAGYDTVQLGGATSDSRSSCSATRTVDARPIDRFVGHGMGCAGIIGALGVGMPPGLAGVAQSAPDARAGRRAVSGQGRSRRHRRDDRSRHGRQDGRRPRRQGRQHELRHRR